MSYTIFAVASMTAFALFAFAPVARKLGRNDAHSAFGTIKPADDEQAGRVDISRVAHSDFAIANTLRTPGFARFCKRTFDLMAAISLIVFTAPLTALTALLIRLDSPGPVIYRQRRIGLDGREFEIFKFRSMRQDAEKDGARWAAADDNRITRIGKFIRRTRIDEIPQAVNILRGEMSFVGPRPERPEFVTMLEQEIPHYHERHIVKPGITGWAQVRHSYTASIDGARDKLAYDLYYVKHYSVLLDLLIVLMTVRVALLGIGSR